MGYLVGAYVVFLGFTALYVVALIARRKRVDADFEELRASRGPNSASRR